MLREQKKRRNQKKQTHSSSPFSRTVTETNTGRKIDCSVCTVIYSSRNIFSYLLEKPVINKADCSNFTGSVASYWVNNLQTKVYKFTLSWSQDCIALSPLVCPYLVPWWVVRTSLTVPYPRLSRITSSLSHISLAQNGKFFTPQHCLWIPGKSSAPPCPLPRLTMGWDRQVQHAPAQVDSKLQSSLLQSCD